MIYAGIGSRETPEHICELMYKIAEKLAKSNWILRSGHAKGADMTFEKGCVSVNGPKEIYTAKSEIPNKAFSIAERYHPMWSACDANARKLHARNGMILLGENLETPCNVVVCYAPGGNKKGGTSQGIRIAEAYHIPILNMFDKDVFLYLKDHYDL
jgi:hypothetical protein